MCGFCDNLTDNSKEILWSVRSRYADDNTCEEIAKDSCSNCNGCKEYFKLIGYNINNNTHMSVEYFKKVANITIRPFSEGIRLNYCPFCMKQLSEEIRSFEDQYPNQISLEDVED